MAEVLLRAALPAASGWGVASAGTSATPGSPASEYSRTVVAEQGLTLEGHCSQQVTPERVEASAMIVAMAQRHIEKILERVPSARDRVYLLRSFDPASPQGSDVSDPYCGSLAEYRACRDVIQQAIPGLVNALVQHSAATDRKFTV
jgi:protein-tyrosine phosphatase